MPLRLCTVRLFVRDLAAAQLFYGGTLGLPQMGGAPAQGFLSYDVGAAELLIEAGDPADEEEAKLIGRFAGVSFEVADCAAAVAALTARGVRFDGEPERQPWGGTLAHFFDPSDNVLTLVQYPA